MGRDTVSDEIARRRSELEGIRWPPISLGDNAAILAVLAELEASEWLPEAVLRTRQTQQLAVLLKHHAKHSPFFSERYKAAGRKAEKVDSLDRLRAIALLTRRDLQAAGASFFATQVPRSHMPVASVASSGSTGEPVQVRKTGVNQLFWFALNLRDHFWHRRRFLGRMTSVRSRVEAHEEFDNWGDPFASLFETGPAQYIPILMDIAQQARVIEKFKPNILTIHPNNLRGLLAAWEEKGFGLRDLKHIKTLAEIVSDDLRQRTRKITGLEIEDTYSSQEVGVIAIQCPESGLYHTMAETVVVEVLDDDGRPCEEGQIGRVVVTDLHNFASPMIRYVNGDHAEVGGKCRCGRGLPTLRRILGRDRNLLVRPDGSRSWPSVELIRFHEVAPVRQFQFIQHSLDTIELKIVSDRELTAPEVAGLSRLTRQLLGQEFQIQVVQTRDRLPASEGGKFEEFICRIV